MKLVDFWVDDNLVLAVDEEGTVYYVSCVDWIELRRGAVATRKPRLIAHARALPASAWKQVPNSEQEKLA